MHELALPDSDSYTLYADIGRNYVVKNLFAAEEFSTRPYQWCYLIVGCMGYRGYFDEDRLQRYREQMQQQGFDVYVTRVTAYSTLGWFDDPVLNTFIDWPEHRLAGLIFHELAHQRLFIDGDTPFNESFAMAVQHAGVERWLQTKGETARLQRYRQYLQNRQQVTGLIERARQDLTRLYQTDMAMESMRRAKQDRLQLLKSEYAQLSAGFEVKDGFKYWFDSELNNAKLASVSTYHAQIPAFRARLAQLDGNFGLFYQQVAELSRLTSEQRSDCLQYWAQAESATGSSTTCP